MNVLPVFYSEKAGSDIETIENNILEIIKSSQVAEGYLARLKQFCTKIGYMPKGGFPYRRVGRSVRGLVFEHKYIVVYEVSDDRVLIRRVLFARRNLKAFRR